MASENMNNNNNNNDNDNDEIPTASIICDYLVIGGGATGMAFCDTLLKYSSSSSTTSKNHNKNLRVVVLDKHCQPGGHWNDTYDFCKLHQPSHMYGVETVPLEPTVTNNNNNHDDEHHDAQNHRATRKELLEYYQTVQTKLEQEYNFQFIGNAMFDFDNEATVLENGNYQYSYTTTTTTATKQQQKHQHLMMIQVTTRLVDARYLQPDIPKHVKPKFTWNSNVIDCVPVNDLVDIIVNDNNNKNQDDGYSNFVIIGAGKTGMDAILYLLQQQSGDISPANIVWVAPNEAWITSREQMGNCMEFLHECVSVQASSSSSSSSSSSLLSLEQVQSTDFLQNGFRSWEKKGKIYRIGQGNGNDNDEPTQFKDATLDQDELQMLRTITQVVRKARLQNIADDGTLELADGRRVPLPFFDDDNNKKKKTLFVHCAAGAFQYTNRFKDEIGPIFQPNRLVLQDVYGTPGFCFVGSILGRLEACDDLTDEERNAMSLCSHPLPPATTPPKKQQDPLGPSGGAVGHLTADHPWILRLLNVRQWYRRQFFTDWLVSNRLFHFKGMPASEALAILDETHDALVKAGLIV